MKKKKLSEAASSGGTSAGSIASVPSGFNFPIITRLPPSNMFGYSEYKPKEEKEDKKK